MNDIEIQGRIIGPGQRPFIIAEMSGNHNESLERALAIVRAAAGVGADAVKLQTYTPDTMTLNLDEGEFRIEDKNSLWRGETLYKLYARAHTPWDWHRPIMELCRELNIICFSTPFDATAVDFLESLNVPAYKIASHENADIPLIKKVAATGKPLFISAGLAEMAELDETVRTVREAGNENLVLLKCTNRPPADPDDTNLATIPHMRELFDVQVGLSDHTLGIGVAVASVAFGATVIEKHLTLNRADGGVDAAFSLEPSELKNLVIETERARQAVGRITYGVTEKEKRSLQFRRSLYIARDMKAGEIFTTENLRAIRPGRGLAPKYYEIFLGKKVARDVKRGTPLSWDLLC